MRPPIIVPSARVYKRYGEYTCKECGFQVSPLKLCNCKAPPPMSEARGEALECADLDRRIRDVQQVKS